MEEERAEGKLQELRRLFNEIDNDGSGAIDKDELRAMLVKLGKPSSDAMLERAIAAMDPDGDGEIDFDEFSKFWGQDGSGVDRLAKMEQSLSGMLNMRSPKGGAKATGGRARAATGVNLSAALDDEDDSDESGGDEWED